MKKIATFIVSIIAILLFLVSSTGISFVVHHCSANHTEEIRLFSSDYQCSHEQTPADCVIEKSKHQHHTCSLTKNHHCCKNTKGYFKIADDYTLNRNDFTINPLTAFISDSFKASGNVSHLTSHIHNSYKPSLQRAGQYLLCLHSQFRI